ncbi:hypothetical protein [Oscillatoria sp. FACHB-1406]|uniref:hypothetical protein n=1 Tax=Oscillatoria sp. FACHB-1406 TaxID=2692846 RepID=UPI001683CB05|nr:hypothetical protein [Oscillatoria sp. FACHB-1406]MBD2577727.1 hypothetical protein [Oscillatoria sp. FACHB-1406]
MNVEKLDRIGDWNPQLYRELKGKLTQRNIILTVILSCLFQSLLILPNLSNRNGVREVQWEAIFQVLNWVLPIFAIAIGVYLLSSDLNREQARGTLNFVRLSPQPSETILLGKFLGVPILLYLGIALILPLHLRAGASLIADLPVGKAFFVLFGIYPIWVGLSSLYYSLAALLMLVNQTGEQKFIPAASSLIALITAPVAMGASARFYWMYYDNSGGMSWNWFFLPESFAYPWILGTLFALNLWMWQIINRRFSNPNQTSVSKAQSYWIVGCTNVWLLGFALPDIGVESGSAGSMGTLSLFAIAPITILLMAALLSPTRQTLLDWARYRHWETAHKRTLLRDLLLGEKSPSLGAIALHLAIIAVIWLPWLVRFIHSPSLSSPLEQIDALPPTALRFILSLCITATVFFIYATLCQEIRFHAKNRKHEGSILLGWYGAMIVPSMIVSLFQISPAQFPVLWLFSPVPFIGAVYCSAFSLFAVFFGQLTILALLVRQFQRQLQRAGESESKKQFFVVEERSQS